MAKLGFFARYPDFFEVARAAVSPKQAGTAQPEDPGEGRVGDDSPSLWALGQTILPRLANLEGKRLITVTKEGKGYRMSLTPLGLERAAALAARPSFAPLVERMCEVKKTSGVRPARS
jgi:hypothetical protein